MRKEVQRVLLNADAFSAHTASADNTSSDSQPAEVGLPAAIDEIFVVGEKTGRALRETPTRYCQTCPPFAALMDPSGGPRFVGREHARTVNTPFINR